MRRQARFSRDVDAAVLRVDQLVEAVRAEAERDRQVRPATEREDLAKRVAEPAGFAWIVGARRTREQYGERAEHDATRGDAEATDADDRAARFRAAKLELLRE